MDLVARPAPPELTPEEWEAGVLRAQAEFHRLGITAWQDARIYDPCRWPPTGPSPNAAS